MTFGKRQMCMTAVYLAESVLTTRLAGHSVFMKRGSWPALPPIMGRQGHLVSADYCSLIFGQFPSRSRCFYIE